MVENEKAKIIGEKSKVKELTDYARGFVESAIDSEGNLSLIAHIRTGSGVLQYLPTLAVANTSREWLEAIKGMTGIGHIYYDSYSKGNRKNIWRWKVVKQVDLKSLLSQIGLIIKEQQRLLLLECLYILPRHRGAYRLSELDKVQLGIIYEQMRILNKKGR